MKDLRDEQPAKALSHRALHRSLTLTVLSDVQPAKVPVHIICKSDGRSIYSMAVHPEKAFNPMFIIPAGSFGDSRDTQPANMLPGKISHPSGISTVFRGHCRFTRSQKTDCGNGRYLANTWSAFCRSAYRHGFIDRPVELRSLTGIGSGY